MLRNMRVVVKWFLLTVGVINAVAAVATAVLPYLPDPEKDEEKGKEKPKAKKITAKKKEVQQSLSLPN